MSPQVAIYIVWGFWFLAWFGQLAFARPDKGTLHGAAAFAFNLVAAFALALLLMILVPVQSFDMQYKLWDRAVPDGLGWAMTAVIFAGFVLSAGSSIYRILYLRHHPGPVSKGPYAIVRHPCYLGLILAAGATALIFGRPTATIGACLLIVALVIKALLEELRADDEAHRAYRAKVPMLVPFWPMPK